MPIGVFTKDSRQRLLMAARGSEDDGKRGNVLISKFLYEVGNSILPLAELYHVMAGLPVMANFMTSRGKAFINLLGNIYDRYTTSYWEHETGNQRKLFDTKATNNAAKVIGGPFDDAEKFMYPSNSFRYQLKPSWENN